MTAKIVPLHGPARSPSQLPARHPALSRPEPETETEIELSAAGGPVERRLTLLGRGDDVRPVDPSPALASSSGPGPHSDPPDDAA